MFGSEVGARSITWAGFGDSPDSPVVSQRSSRAWELRAIFFRACSSITLRSRSRRGLWITFHQNTSITNIVIITNIAIIMNIVIIMNFLIIKQLV